MGRDRPGAGGPGSGRGRDRALGIIGRLAAYGLSPNKTAALGENIALMVNLVLLAAGYVRFLTWRSHYETVIAWQMRYLPVHAVWAAFVALAFPPLFGFA